MKKYLNIANIMTFSRIIGSLILLLTEPMTKQFFVIYSLCGISDMLDGFTARMLGQSSDFGAKLDSVSDLTMYSVLLFKIIPIIRKEIENAFFAVAAIIAIIRIFSYVYAAVKFKHFSSMHTYLNKLCGFTLFLTPYMMGRSFTEAFCFAVCLIAGISTLEEFVIHLTEKNYNPERKTILFNNTNANNCERGDNYAEN